VKVRITSNVDSHGANPRYKCLVVEWNGDDNFRCRPNGSHDWLPTDREFIDLVVAGIRISPTLWLKVLEQINPASRLHELL